MKVILQPKCKVEIFNPGDEEVIVDVTGVVICGSPSNKDYIAIKPPIALGDGEVIWIK